MSIEIQSDKAQEFLNQALTRGIVDIQGNLSAVSSFSQRSTDMMTTLSGGGRNLVIESRNRHLGELFVYGLGHEGTLRLGIVTLAEVRSPENNFANCAVLADEAGGREKWQLYAPVTILPADLYPQLEIPEVQNALLSSMYLNMDSVGKGERIKVERAWEMVLVNASTHPLFPQTVAQRMRRILP